MAELLDINLEDIVPSDHMLEADHSYDGGKVASIGQSMGDIGPIPGGVLGRSVGNKVQIASGHYIIQAAKAIGLKTFPVIVSDITDDQMMQISAHDKTGDYNITLLGALGIWESTMMFLASSGCQNPQPLDIAKKIFWTAPRARPGAVQMNRTAEACNATVALIEGGYLKRRDFMGLPMLAAREILVKGSANMRRIDKAGAKNHTPHPEIKAAKLRQANSIKKTIKEAIDGDIAINSLRARVDENTYELKLKQKSADLLFGSHAKRLCGRVAAMLNTDATNKKLIDIESARFELEYSSDKELVIQVISEIEALQLRCGDWIDRLQAPSSPVKRPKLVAIGGTGI